LEREWKLQNTNFDQTYSIDISLNPCAVTNNVSISDLRLLIDDNGDFTNAQVYAAGEAGGISFSYAEPIITISGLSASVVPLNQTAYITIGSISEDTPLPVNLISFDATVIDDKSVQLEWATATESNNDFFTVERSTNTLFWEAVTEVNGAGNSSIEISYAALDNDPYWETSYYRIRQTDFDGKFTFSPVEPVTIDIPQDSEVIVFPNPTNGQVTIKANTYEMSDIKIVDMLGRDVTKDVVIKIISDTEVRIDLTILPAGLFNIKTKTSDNRVFYENP
jgi:hypothetical protein